MAEKGNSQRPFMGNMSYSQLKDQKGDWKKIFHRTSQK
jgi:hypothetical protein